LFVDLFDGWLVGSFFVGGSFVGLMVVGWLVRLLVGGCLISKVGSRCSVFLKKLTVVLY